VVVPTFVLYEVYKLACRERSRPDGMMAVARMSRHLVVALDEKLALAAADLSLRHRLPMADAIVYATAQAFDALLITSDRHFAHLPGVEYLGDAEASMPQANAPT
jgi:predicted nucleic acid-binding protein